MPPDKLLNFNCSMSLTLKCLPAYHATKSTLYLYYSLSLEQEFPSLEPISRNVPPDKPLNFNCSMSLTLKCLPAYHATNSTLNLCYSLYLEQEFHSLEPISRNIPPGKPLNFNCSMSLTLKCLPAYHATNSFLYLCCSLSLEQEVPSY